MTPYPAPLDALLSLGEPAWDDWLDYRRLGLMPDHVAELTRMATDPDLNRGGPDSPEVYAPAHAWRALGQLGAVQAIPDLLGLIDPTSTATGRARTCRRRLLSWGQRPSPHWRLGCTTGRGERTAVGRPPTD